MTAHTTARKMGQLCRTRPFAAGVATALAGVELVAVVCTSPGLLRFAGGGATASWVLGGLLVVAGATMLTQPQLRYFAGVVAIVTGLLSLVQANLGGFGAGFVLAAAGGALALAWTPLKAEGPPRAHQARFGQNPSTEKEA
ncbi:DUF6114 domain-containing protein [Lentzea jiangxiensis]|uniref:Integral membrane protein n=1 Tax=Lentzea jiangxiensis TaxID=641025 RepID=A0A1H0X5C5_9PSEU|nr:DUF6114 domain-containing protein [Lentzea jiangxiensis]SDP98148.1 hypothetical protein SAMN05421507_1369 [Lentzea jiangxiensis]